MLKRITERCHYLPPDGATDRPALGYVHGDRMSLMIDAGNSPDHYGLMMHALDEAGQPQPDLIALTHFHWDHTFGLCVAACPSICCMQTQAHLIAMSGWEWTLPAMEKRLETREDIRFCHDFMLKEYPDPSAIRVVPATQTFEDRCELDLGGCHAVLLRLPNSHAEDCVVIHIPEEGVIYLGDICYADLHHEPPCWHRARYEALRAALEPLSFDHAVLAHQEIKDREGLFGKLARTLSEGEFPVMD